jgi:rhamnogalacturonyl hydrolase YesR
VTATGYAWLAALLGAIAPSSAFSAESKDPFGTWPQGASPEHIGAKLVHRFLETEDHMLWTERGTLHYAEVVTWYGALNYAQLAHAPELTQRLVVRFEPFLAGEQRALVPPVNHVDHSVFGAVPLEIYLQTANPRHRMLGLAFADGQWDRPTFEGLTNQTRYWIDDMYMITLLQAQASRATGDPKYIDRTAQEMVAYLDRLQQPNGLFFHAPDAPFFWGRGNGWMAAGMTELLRSLPIQHPHRPRILAAYRQMMATLLKHQSSGGMWRQLIDRPEAWFESSSSAMFTFAFVSGVREGWLEEADYAPAARKAWLALLTYINEAGDVREVCVGTGTKNDLQYYLDRPRAVGDYHGQAPILWTVSALLR